MSDPFSATALVAALAFLLVTSGTVEASTTPERTSRWGDWTAPAERKTSSVADTDWRWPFYS